MREIQERAITTVMGIALILSMLAVAKEAASYVTSGAVPQVQAPALNKVCVVIDAGHGGFDPGKV